MRAILSITCSAVLLTADVAISQEPEQAPVTLQNERAQPTAQNQGGLEVMLHRDARFGGPFQSITGPRTDLNLGWEVRSIRVRSGEWQICTGRNYTGRCTTIDRDQPTLSQQFRDVVSVRPTGGWGTGVGQSLRGAASEFFPAPRRNGERIECRAGANCARQEANQFCRSLGWLVSRTQGTETVGGKTYVTDVLCARALL
ncbi:hypothetical protein [Novosphingobium sp. ZW T3_23]|uniref:hypothetical protein n=1 Tax=Novosphingobium sp. ZW T3_23 TaxID=3378084 RepID=UPI003853BBD0